MMTQCVVRAAECNFPWRGKCPKDKRGPSPARGPSRSETLDDPCKFDKKLKQYEYKKISNFHTGDGINE